MEKECIKHLLIIYIMEIGLMAKDMAGELRINKMEKDLKVNGYKIKKKGEVNMYGQMEKK